MHEIDPQVEQVRYVGGERHEPGVAAHVRKTFHDQIDAGIAAARLMYANHAKKNPGEPREAYIPLKEEDDHTIELAPLDDVISTHPFVDREGKHSVAFYMKTGAASLTVVAAAIAVKRIRSHPKPKN